MFYFNNGINWKSYIKQVGFYTYVESCYSVTQPNAWQPAGLEFDTFAASAKKALSK